MFNHTDAMRQAPMTVEVYFNNVVKMLDQEFGKGYALNNPQLIGMLVNACAQDYHSAILGIISDAEMGNEINMDRQP